MFKKFIIILVTLSIIISLASCTGGIVTPPQDDDNSLQLEQEFQDNQETITHHLEEIAEPGKTPERYAQELAALLMNESQVSKVAVFENSINLTYASGKIHFIRFTDKEEGDEGYLFGGGSLHSSSALRDLLFKERDEVLFRGSSYQQREESSAIPLEERAIDIQDFTKSDQFRQAPSQEKLLQNRNILVWSPFTIYADMLYLDLSLRLLGEDHLGFNVKLIRDKKATMDSLKEITNYGMIFLFTHGDPDGKCIVTGEEITKDNEVHMLDDGVYYSSEKKISSTYPYIEEKPTYFAVSYDWISANVPKNENNKIVIVDACHCGTVDWWNAFSTIGAGDYFGWDGRVNTPCIINRSGNLILELKYGVSTTEDVYKPYICNFGRGIWKRFGYPVRFAVSDNPPVISNLSANPPSVDINQPTTITCTASDPDGDPLTYDWTVNAGSFEGDTSGPSVTWRAPATSDIYIVVGCEVSDGKGGEDTETLNIVINGPTEEDKLENVIHKFFQALNDRDWNEARDCCIYGADTYEMVNEMEECYNLYGALACEIPNEYVVDDINQIKVDGQHAEAYVCISAIYIVDGEMVELQGEGWCYLQKINNDWKIGILGSQVNEIYTITATAASHGSISPSGSVTVYHGAYKSFTITPDTGYQIDDVLVDGSSVGAVSSYIFTNITQDHRISATFKIENSGTYTITATAGPNGSISPSGSITVNQGADKSFTITPDTGYQIDDVLVDESSVGKVSSYTFTNIIQDHTISATFKIVPSGTYSLRDIGPAGGCIFYDKGYYSSGWRYLEAAPVSTEWNHKQWGSDEAFIGGTETGIGTGQSNTTIIAAWLNSHSETDRAAQLCDDLTEGGYNDWFLPSKDELNLMYVNLCLFGIGGFADGYYFSLWSSSESNTYDAWAQYFGNGFQSYGGKFTALWVRAVRAF